LNRHIIRNAQHLASHVLSFIARQSELLTSVYKIVIGAFQMLLDILLRRTILSHCLSSITASVSNPEQCILVITALLSRNIKSATILLDGIVNPVDSGLIRRHSFHLGLLNNAQRQKPFKHFSQPTSCLLSGTSNTINGTRGSARAVYHGS